MKRDLKMTTADWRLDPSVDTGAQIAAMPESVQAARLLRDSITAVLLGEHSVGQGRASFLTRGGRRAGDTLLPYAIRLHRR